MKVLSLFDGMACGVLALMKAVIEVESYDAFEIDKYAIQTSTHNFPFIKHHGDVFSADFTKFYGVDLLCGGSPCTYWSIAQKNGRETEASGMGWELFQQYVRAVKEARPKYFIYENNKSMSKQIRASIDEAFGFEAVLINSALVSAQNRQRLYWVGKRNADGTYSRVDIEQPEDKGILLRDILETNGCEAINVCEDGKSHTVKAQYYKNGIANFVTNNGFDATAVAEPVRVGCMPSPDGTIKNSQGMRIYSVDGKSVNQTAQGGGMGAKTGLYAVPICHIIPQEVTVRKHTCDIEKFKTLFRESKKQSKLTNKQIAETFNKPITEVEHWFRNDNCFSVPDADIWHELKKLLDITTTEFDAYVTEFETREGVFEKSERCYDVNGKMSTLMTGTNDNIIAPANKQDKHIYEVKDGLITIKGKQYPIKLADGFYIIRKLTVRECMRLQTVPEWYEFPVSNAQAYKMLGNGWTVDVIAHILRGLKEC